MHILSQDKAVSFAREALSSVIPCDKVSIEKAGPGPNVMAGKCRSAYTTRVGYLSLSGNYEPVMSCKCSAPLGMRMTMNYKKTVLCRCEYETINKYQLDAACIYHTLNPLGPWRGRKTLLNPILLYLEFLHNPRGVHPSCLGGLQRVNNLS